MDGRSPWGTFEVRDGASGRWQLGPLCLRIRRRPHEWWIAPERGSDPLARGRAVELPEATSVAADENDPAAHRFAVADPSPAISFQPRLPDRAVVARLEQPLVVPAGEAVEVFLTSPVWVRIGYGKKDRDLAELPTYVLSDAWLGPSTMAGELAYAIKAPCQTELDRIPRRPHRAITAAWIENRGTGPLELTRLSLPLDRLALFATDDDLWTRDVRLLRREGAELAQLEVSEGPPARAHTARLVARPRTQNGKNLMVRAFVQLFR